MRWHLLNSGPTAPAENMAWDEALLEAALRLGRPLLRFYGWAEPAATFGYFQRFSDVQRVTRLRPLIRRPTGGGVVPHDSDWTYSLVFPSGHPWHQLKAVDSYRRVHAWVQAAFARAGLATDLASCSRKEVPGQCFLGAEQFDVLWQGHKIAGAAQRRTREGLLIQGSIQPPAGSSRGEFEQAFRGAAAEQWSVEWQMLEVDVALADRVAELARAKYLRRDYNERR